MAASATWDDLLLIVRGLSNRKNGPPVTGDLLIADESVLAALKACHESETDTHLCLANGAEPSTLAIGQTVSIEVSPRFGFGLLTSNVGSLLRAQYARVKEPLHFYLLDDGLSQFGCGRRRPRSDKIPCRSFVHSNAQASRSISRL